jgi:hypothetical protein
LHHQTYNNCFSTWAAAAFQKATLKKQRAVQRRMGILMLRDFRTTPTAALLVLSGLTPAEHNISELTTLTFMMKAEAQL